VVIHFLAERGRNHAGSAKPTSVEPQGSTPSVLRPYTENAQVVVGAHGCVPSALPAGLWADSRSPLHKPAILFARFSSIFSLNMETE
jgi:hypothetical protein